MDTTVVIGVIAACSAILGPLVLSLLTGRQQARARLVEARVRREEKKEDWARQDAVATQAAEAARLLLVANEEVAAAARVTDGKLDVIHTLVNSNMTASMQSELDAKKGQVVLMREVVTLKQAAGQEPTKAALASIEAAESRISELEAALSDRRKQQDVVEAQEGARPAG